MVIESVDDPVLTRHQGAGVEDTSAYPLVAQLDLQRAPPPLLYHYTNRAGLLGIIEGRKLWASCCSFLNDAAEFVNASKRLQEAVARRCSADDRVRRLLRDFCGRGVGFDGLVNFVASLSQDGDLLSQWRAYGRPGDAYAIAFRSQALLDELAAQEVVIAPCIYEPQRQASVLDRAVDALIEAGTPICASAAGEAGSDMSRGEAAFAIRSMLRLLEVCVLVKHPSFAEEREWRLTKVEVTGLKFREGPSFLVPYVELALDKTVATGIDHIVIGPTPSPERDFRSLRWFLADRLGQGAVKILHSASPFRAW